MLPHSNSTCQVKVLDQDTWSSKRFLLSKAGTKGPEVGSHYKDREARLVHADLEKKIISRRRVRRAGGQTGSLFSFLFLDKYLISGTLMGID